MARALVTAMAVVSGDGCSMSRSKGKGEGAQVTAIAAPAAVAMATVRAKVSSWVRLWATVTAMAAATGWVAAVAAALAK